MSEAGMSGAGVWGRRWGLSGVLLGNDAVDGTAGWPGSPGAPLVAVGWAASAASAVGSEGFSGMTKIGGPLSGSGDLTAPRSLTSLERVWWLTFSPASLSRLASSACVRTVFLARIARMRA
jgi:hypothetical protein